jgi:hypothetical protein
LHNQRSVDKEELEENYKVLQDNKRCNPERRSDDDAFEINIQ